MFQLSEYPLVSVVVPCRNEEQHIGALLDSILGNEYPHDRLEILIADGMSDDKTRQVVQEYSRRWPQIRLVDNPKRVTAAGCNAGIRTSRGDVVMILGAHSTCDPQYIPLLIRYLYEQEVDDVGGQLIVLPREETVIGRAIAGALSHRFGVGNSLWRTGGVEEPRLVDVVSFGCFRREVFARIGLFEEHRERRWSEDLEFNFRLRAAGGKILLVPGAKVYYYARSDLQAFCRHMFDNGFLVTYPLKYGQRLFSARHLVPTVFVASVLGLATLAPRWRLARWAVAADLAAYLLANLGASLDVARRERDATYVLTMPGVFAALHVSHGLGGLWGLAQALTSADAPASSEGPPQLTEAERHPDRAQG